MIGIRNFGRIGRPRSIGLTFSAFVVVLLAPAFAQEVAGTYTLLGDSDGTKPVTGAKLELTFTGGAAGSVKLFAVRPGETVRDTGTYSIVAHRITIHFKQVDWAANHQPYTLDGCTLTLPFMAVSAASGPGASTWQREASQCTGLSTSAAQSPPLTAKFSPFSADEVITQANQRRTMKVYATEVALRSESSENGQEVVTIMRFDRNLVWVLTPGTRTFTETSANFGGGSTALQQAPLAAGCRSVGEEQVGGYSCSKVSCRTNLGKRDYTETQWSARTLGGLVVKYTDGVETMELENIKLGSQDPKLFEVPAGYQKQASK